MAIPSGYRLLTAEDVGKVFGVDLELDVYFDNEATIPLYSKSIELTNFMSLSFATNAPPWDDYGEAVNRNSVTITTPSTHYIYDYFEGGEIYNYTPYWWNTSYTFTENTEITSFNTVYNWNNWFYVKDKSDPYSIKIKNKEGIKLLTKDKDIHFDDDVKVTIDESLLGGGEKTGIVTYTINYDIQDNGRLYIGDGYQGTEAITGQGTLTIVGGYALIIRVEGYGFGGGSLTLGGTNMQYFAHTFNGEGYLYGTVYMSSSYLEFDEPLSVTIDLETYED